MQGRCSIVQIFVCTEAAGLPQAVETASAVPGRGLEGDRYFAGSGTWSYEPSLWSDLTLIESEALKAVAAAGLDLAPGEARRNVVTVGVDLASLIGHRFRIGEVELMGERPCDPCRHLDRLTGKPAKSALAGRGGLRAQILTSGTVRVGDPIVLALGAPRGDPGLRSGVGGSRAPRRRGGPGLRRGP